MALKCVGGQGGGWLLAASSTADLLPHPTSNSSGRVIISEEGAVDEGSQWIEEQKNRRQRKDAVLGPTWRGACLPLPSPSLSWDHSLLSLRCHKPLSLWLLEKG